MARTDAPTTHPSDERLFEAVFDAASPSAAAIRQHLDGCAGCRERWAHLVAELDGWRESAEADADAAFTDDRLERQRDRVGARIAALARGARVVPFPALRTRTFGSPQAVVLRRWVSLAAAAGLFVGLAVGRLSFAPDRPVQQAAPTVAVAAAAQGPERTAAPAASPSGGFRDDEQFLTAIEESVARSRSRIRELQAIDQLTPRFRTMAANLH